MERNYYAYCTPVGFIYIESAGEQIAKVQFSKSGISSELKETPIIREAFTQLNQYFKKERRGFDLPLLFEGTAFQQSVWRALTEIPYAEVRSYAQIAAAVGNPRACRAVGGANNCNPIAIIVPCHRVIGSSGALVGYAGGMDTKRFLLELECPESGLFKK